jgi:hypothetical protein
MPLNKPKSSMLDAGSTTAPQNLGATASAGTGPALSFADHVHARPSAADVGAIATTAKAAANGVASLDGNARLNGVQMPAISGDVTINAGETTAAVNKVKGVSVSTPTVTGTIAQFDGTNIVWGSAPAGGSGGGGIVMFFNNGTAGDAPLTALPALTGGETYKEFRRVAETGQTSVTSPNLTNSYSNIAGFITDLNDPETVEITAGLWDFNVWASTIDARTLLRAVLYKYNGITESWVTLSTSAAVAVPTVAGQLVFSLIIPQTTIALTDRIFVVFQALNPAANHTVTLQFGGSTPSHTHTTLPSVGKTGVVKVINGVTQADASKIVNADIDDAAAIEQSKISGTVPVVKGGTGQTSYVDGELIIGNSTGNTLTKSTLTAGTGITVTNGSGSITLAAKGFGGNTKTVGVDHATIQGCIDLCTSASQSNTYSVLIPAKAGGYVENLTLKGSVSLVGLTSDLSPNLIQINGSHTYAPALASPNANRLGFQGLTFTSASGAANTITVTPTGADPYPYSSQLRFSGCTFSGDKNNTFSQISTCDNVSLYIDNCRFESAGGGTTSAGVTQGNGPLYLSNNTIFNVFGRALDVPVSTTTTRTATSTLNSSTLMLTVGDTTGLAVGQKISGTGIPAGTIIVGLTVPSTVLMSSPPTAIAVGFIATFGNAPYVEIHDAILQGAGNEVVRLGNGLLTCSTSNFTNAVGSGINMLTAGTLIGIIHSSFAISTISAFTITAAAAPCYAVLNSISYSSFALLAYSTLIGANVTVYDYAARATPISNGGTGAITQQAAITALAGTQVSGRYLRSNGTITSLSSIVAGDVPTLNQSTTGTAANVSGTVAIANGGTGATSKSAAFNALSPIAATGDLIIGSGASAASALAIGTTGKVLTSNGSTATWETPSGGAGGVTTIANGGTGATTAQVAISNLGIGMRMVEAQTNVTNIPGTMVGNTFTITAQGVFTTDGYTPVLGDIIAFALQGGGTSIQNGFWEVTTVGAAGVSPVFTRPAWFTGVVKNGMYMPRFGATQSGYVMAFFGPGGNTDITVGTTAIQAVRVNSRLANATTSINLFTGYQSFRANGTGANQAPFFFQAGAALMTAPQGHAVEWFGDNLYITTSTAIRKKVSYLEDSVVISATVPSAVVFDIENSEVLYHTANTTADFTVNLRGSSTLTMNSILEVNKARTVVLMVTNSTTAYKVSTVSVDGAAQTVKWLGGSAPSAGNVSSIDSYSFTVIKTAANTYTVLGSVVKFA